MKFKDNSELKEAIRKLGTEKVVKDLKEERENLYKKRESIKLEYMDLAWTFCKQRGKHYYWPFVDEFGFEREGVCLVCGVEYGTERIEECFHRIVKRSVVKNINEFYKEGSEATIIKASQQSENPELQKTAQRILKIQKEEFDNIEKELDEIQKTLDEICILFRHDIIGINSCLETGRDYRCNCCGKMFSGEDLLRLRINNYNR